MEKIRKIRSPYDVDFSKVTLPEGVTRDILIQRYESTLDDLNYLKKQFRKYVRDRKAPYQILATSLYDAIQMTVHYNGNVIDVQKLSFLVPKESQPLYIEIVKLIYGIVDGKPKTDATLMKFKSLLCVYLCIAGF